MDPCSDREFASASLSLVRDSTSASLFQFDAGRLKDEVQYPGFEPEAGTPEGTTGI